MTAPAYINRSLAFVQAHPDLCSTEVSRGGESQPCDKTAYAVAIDDEIGATWPVCIHHARGRQLMPLAELLDRVGVCAP